MPRGRRVTRRHGTDCLTERPQEIYADWSRHWVLVVVMVSLVAEIEEARQIRTARQEYV
jgi:hypothetical protein